MSGLNRYRYRSLFALTGDAMPYHEGYHPAQFWGGMFTTVGNSPHFAWRLIAPSQGAKEKKP